MSNGSRDSPFQIEKAEHPLPLGASTTLETGARIFMSAKIDCGNCKIGSSLLVSWI
ncbi:hypothetical protein RESH_00752 [Rhodopirellula europaea SH398]|jgi:hypothetical protein|uniref:Uncharacterized protein n=1 Tax=Rhodopirellula europaea SH398 TaxID=1263868 RepID=M5SAX9_9BACT|nr:hypothetical protein RESH_00752 [Rhodopirellula europaea SH398]